MGKVMTIPGTVTAPTGKLLYEDPIMSKGSIMLFDPSHSLGAFSGVPANTDVLPNVAWAVAADILGSGDANTLGAVCYRDNDTSGASVMERSGNGGLHGLFSEVTTGGAGESNYFGIRTPTPISQYLFNNSDNELFFSMWMRVTRNIGTTATVPQSPFNWAINTSDYLFHTQRGDQLQPSGANRVGARAGVNIQAAAEGTPTLINIATTAFSGTKPGSWPGTQAIAATGAHSAWNGFNKAHPLSAIIERVYIEDLTVSGRSYAEVDALDLELHTAAHAAGGDWYGDTYTDPATFL